MELQDPRPAYTMSGEEALATLDTLHAQIAALETYRLEVITRLDDTGHAQTIGAHDTARLIATRHRKNLGTVRRDLALAKALPKYPAVTAALPDPYAPAEPDTDGGEPDGADPQGPWPVVLHPAQAQAIIAALEAIPTTAMVPVEDLQIAEEQMVEAARHLPPWELSRLGAQVRNLPDTDGPEPAEDAAARREAFWLKNADQGIKFGGYLSSERAALLRTMIEPAAKPRKTPDGDPDPRPRDKRQADRFTDILHLAAGTGELPGNGGVKPHITVTIDLADLIAAGKDTTGDLQFGESLSAGAVRRLACDAEIIPIVLGGDSEPLDVGRAKRFITPAMRKALNLRDKGCVVCGAAPIYCDAHHITSWLDGGPTSINNLALFCRAHHTDADKGHYLITITNGTVHVTRPTWADPPTTPPPPTPHPPTSYPTRPGTPTAEPTTADASRSGKDRTPRPHPTRDQTDPRPAATNSTGERTGARQRPAAATNSTEERTGSRHDAGVRAPEGAGTNPTADRTATDRTVVPAPNPARAGKSTEQKGATGKILHPVAALPMDDDPPPLIIKPGPDPWGPDVPNTQPGDPQPVAADPEGSPQRPMVLDTGHGFDPWGPEVFDTRADGARRPIAEPGFDPWDPAVADTG